MKEQETNSAIVQQVTPDLVVTRYKPGAMVDAQAVKDNIQARLNFSATHPYAVVGIFPDDVDFDMSALENDHFKGEVLNEVTQVMAIVAHGDTFDTMAQMYFALHPTQFASRVFRMEIDAFQWVNERIKVWRAGGAGGAGQAILG